VPLARRLAALALGLAVGFLLVDALTLLLGLGGPGGEAWLALACAAAAALALRRARVAERRAARRPVPAR
jgi:hypothetical protein